MTVQEVHVAESKEQLPNVIKPFLPPAHPALDGHLAIMDKLSNELIIPESTVPFAQREKEIEDLPKILIIGSDEPALRAAEQLLEAGMAVVIVEEEPRVRSLDKMDQKKAKWGLGVLAHPHAVVILHHRMNPEAIRVANFAGIIVSKEQQKERQVTPVDRSLPLVVPAGLILHPRLNAADFEQKIALPQFFPEGKRFGIWKAGKIGTIGVVGADPLQAVNAAYHTAVIQLVDAASRKHGVHQENFTFSKLASQTLKASAERLMLRPGDVGVTSLLVPNAAYLESIGVSPTVLEDNLIHVEHNVRVRGAVAAESPEILHVDLEKDLTLALTQSAITSFAGLVVADGHEADFKFLKTSAPLVRVGAAGDGRNKKAEKQLVAKLIDHIRARGEKPRDSALDYVHALNGEQSGYPMNYVADHIVSSHPVFWNHKEAKKTRLERVGDKVPAFLHQFLFDPKERNAGRKSIEGAANDIWVRYGLTYNEWVKEKEQFVQGAGHVEVAVFGGDTDAYEVALDIRRQFKHAHVVIFEKEAYAGGATLVASGLYDPAQKYDTIDSMTRVLTDPGIDVITRFDVKDEEIPWIKNRFGFQVMIDARPGKQKAYSELQYDGTRIMTASDFVREVAAPYAQDGHFGRIHLPVSYSDKGIAHPAFIVGRGAHYQHLASFVELVRTVDDIEAKWKIPREFINPKALAKGGLIHNRINILGFPSVTHVPTVILHDASLDTSPEQMIQSLQRQKDSYGTHFLVGATLMGHKERPNTDLMLSIAHAGDYIAYPASFLVTAVGFEPRKQIAGVIALDSWWRQTQIEKAMKEAVPADIDRTKAFIGMVRSHQMSDGHLWTHGTYVDPVVQFLRRAPEAMIAERFRDRPDEHKEHVSSKNELLDALANAHTQSVVKMIQAMRAPVESVGLGEAPNMILPEVPYPHRNVGSIDELREAVLTRRAAHAKAMILSQLDTLKARAMAGGYNDPSEVNLPPLDALNILMNVTEKDIVLNHFYTEKRTDRPGTDQEWQTAEYISIRLVDKQKKTDQLVDLPLRMNAEGVFQYRGEYNTWHTIEDIGTLREVLGQALGGPFPEYDGDGEAYMEQFAARLRSERAQDALLYLFSQLSKLGLRYTATEEQLTFLAQQCSVSPEGYLFLRRFDTATHAEEFEWLASDNRMRSVIERMLATNEPMISQKEERIESFQTHALNTSAVIAGLLVNMGFNQLVGSPTALSLLPAVMFGPAVASMHRSFLHDEGRPGQTKQEYTINKLKRKLSGAALWFLGAIAVENSIEARIGVGNEYSNVGVSGGDAHMVDTMPQDIGLIQDPVSVPEPEKPVAETPAQETTSTFDPELYVGEWQVTMTDMADKLGGTEGWMNTADNNGVSQAKVMTHWELILEKGTTMTSEQIDWFIDQIAQTTTVEEYFELRERVLLDYVSKLAQ